MNEYVESDLYRYAGRTDWLSFAHQYISNHGFRYMVAHRLVNSGARL